MDNDIEDEDIIEEGPPVLVMYHKKSNEAVVYHGNESYLWKILKCHWFSGKREFDLLVNFVETGKFEYFEYPFEDDEMEGEEAEADEVEIEEDGSDKVEIIGNDQEEQLATEQRPGKEEL